MASKEGPKFGSLLKKAAGTVWHKARKAKRQFTNTNLPVGTHVGRLSSITANETKNGDPVFNLKFVVESGENKGKFTNVSHFINDSEFSSREENLERFVVDLKACGLKTDDLDLDDIDSAIESLVKEKPMVRFSVKESKRGNKFTQLQQKVKDDDEDPEEDVEDEEPSEEEGDDGDPEPEPEVGCFYGYKYRGKTSPCEVTTINFQKQTVSLRRHSDEKTFKSVPFADLGDEYDVDDDGSPFLPEDD